MYIRVYNSKILRNYFSCGQFMNFNSRFHGIVPLAHSVLAEAEMSGVGWIHGLKTYLSRNCIYPKLTDNRLNCCEIKTRYEQKNQNTRATA